MQSPPVRSVSRRPPRWLVVLISYIVAIVCLIWVFKGVDFGTLMEDLRTLKWRYIAAAVVLELLVYVCQAWRWNTLLLPAERLRLWPTTKAIYIGVFASGVLPLRAGEVIRCYLLAFWNKLPVSLAFTSGAIERVIDGILLVGAFAVTAKILTIPRYLIDGVEVMAVVLASLAAVFLYVLFHKQHAHTLLSRTRWGTKFAHVLDEIHHLGNWRTLGTATGLSVLYLLLQIGTIWALIQAYDLDVTTWASVAILTILRVGTIAPGAPGNVGMLQFFVLLALEKLGIDKTTSAGFSFVTWAALTFPPIIAGAFVLMFAGLDIGEVHRHARTARRDYRAGRPAQ